jgi:uncharacterized membrane protein YfcA
MTEAGLALAGMGAGVLGAILGLGGGVFLIPLLVLFFKIPMINAVAAGLAAIIATSSSVASVNVNRGTANMRLGMVLELATVAGALAGSLYAALLPGRFLIGLFGALLAVISLLLWKRRKAFADFSAQPAGQATGRLDGEYDDPASGGRIVYSVQRLPVGMGVSFAAGALSGLLGIGGGVFKVPALHLYCGVPMKAAAATSNFMIGVTGAASAFLYFSRGDMLPRTTACVVLGVMLGSLIGIRINHVLPDAAVRRFFALLTAVLSIQMLLRAVHG